MSPLARMFNVMLLKTILSNRKEHLKIFNLQFKFLHVRIAHYLSKTAFLNILLFSGID